jgi:hypothetical protein
VRLDLASDSGWEISVVAGGPAKYLDSARRLRLVWPRLQIRDETWERVLIFLLDWTEAHVAEVVRLLFSFIEISRQLKRILRIMDGMGDKDNQHSTYAMLPIAFLTLQRMVTQRWQIAIGKIIRMYCPQTNCKFTEFPEIQSKNVTGYNKEQRQRIVFNQCKNVSWCTLYKTSFCQLFNSSSIAKGRSYNCSRCFRYRSLQVRSWIRDKGCSLPLASPA